MSDARRPARQGRRPRWPRSSRAPARSRRWRSAAASATGKGRDQVQPRRPTRRTAAAAASRPGRRSRCSSPRPRWRRATPFDYGIYSPYQVDIGPVEACNGETLYDKWDPVNETESENGYYTLQTGIEGSINTYFAQLERAGRRLPAGADRGGAGRAPGRRQEAPGGQVVHPRRQRGVAADHGRGLRDVRRARHRTATPSRSSRSTDPSGNRLSVPDADCQQVIDQEIADGMNQLLAGRHDQRHRRRAAQIGRPAAGKTGTTNQSGSRLVRRLHARPRDRRLGRQPVAAGGRLPAVQTGSSAAATTATSAVAACPGRSGRHDEPHAGRRPGRARSASRPTTSSRASRSRCRR